MQNLYPVKPSGKLGIIVYLKLYVKPGSTDEFGNSVRRICIHNSALIQASRFKVSDRDGKAEI